MAEIVLVRFMHAVSVRDRESRVWHRSKKNANATLGLINLQVFNGLGRGGEEG